MQNLYILTGYTATGKTELSLEIAEQMNGEIVSCDSLLVYRNLDIGTAKPTLYDLSRVKHHCINLVEGGENFDVNLYIKEAYCAVDDILSRGKNVLIVGGSGFYLKSFFHPVVDDIKTTFETENFIRNYLHNNEIGPLVDKLLKLNNGHVDIDLKNPRRVISALRLCMSTGKTLVEMNKNLAQRKSKFYAFNKRTILLTRDGADLKQRVYLRVKNMVDTGLIDEIRSLLAHGQFNDNNKNAIGYGETIKWLQTGGSVDELVEEICAHTLKFIKKQKTWFKKQIPINGTINLSQTSFQVAQTLIRNVFFS
ncbi:MAG: tRNA (adenosine(37)-N6)-dimethylallyltransferase MiaA [Puniceicoccales bacterium]|jgi:tRNA dimethylallyltransferase|nr:tRNA (adenosine(37)-N6)-dimethylallyltransferase MiaA [Puniceicoccales bacterium]